KIELMVEHTNGYSGEVAKAASVVTNDAKLANFTLTLRARFIMDAQPVAGAPAPVNKRSAIFVEPTDHWITSVLVGNTTSSNLYMVNNGATLAHIKSINAGGTTFT